MTRYSNGTRPAWTMLVMVATAAVVGGAAVQGQATATDVWPALTVRLERAVTTGSLSDLRAVRGDLLRVLTSKDRSRESLAQYAMAYLAWRMAFVPGATDKERDDLLEDGVARLVALVEREPENAEAHALLGGLYGVQIGRAPLKGILLGPRAGAAIERASRVARDNPRVALLDGIGAFNTPAIFGGGNDKAERLLRHSLQAFAREPAGHPWPNWGRADAHAWLGQVLARKGDRRGARSEYDKGLSVAPDNGWIKFVLLPALEGSGKP